MKAYISLNLKIFIAVSVFLSGTPVNAKEEKPKTDHDVCVCPMDYEPVCATDNKTYSNTCALACAQRFDSGLLALCHSACPCNPLLWTYLNLTSTETSVKARLASDDVKHSCDCTKIWKPVCGSDGITYSNQCLLDCEHAKDSNIITLFDGECA